MDDQKAKPRGVPFAKGNELGFKGHPENINRTGRPKTKIISDAYRLCLEDDLPVDAAKVAGVTAHLEKIVDGMSATLGRRPTYAEVLAVGMLISAMGGNSAAAKELREVTEGRLPEKIDLSGKIDYTAGQTAKEILAGRLVGKVEPPKEEGDA